MRADLCASLDLGMRMLMRNKEPPVCRNLTFQDALATKDWPATAGGTKAQTAPPTSNERAQGLRCRAPVVPRVSPLEAQCCRGPIGLHVTRGGLAATSQSTGSASARSLLVSRSLLLPMWGHSAPPVEDGRGAREALDPPPPGRAHAAMCPPAPANASTLRTLPGGSCRRLRTCCARPDVANR